MRKLKIGDVLNLKESIYEALGGRVDEALKLLNSYDEKVLSKIERDLVKNYNSRFSCEVRFEAISDEATIVNELINAYQNYWYHGLLNKQSKKEGEKELFNSLKLITRRHCQFEEEFSGESMALLEEEVRKMLREKGYFSILGTVSPFRNLIIWKKEFIEIFNIDLGDQRQSVEVVMMDDFVNLGWAGYATFNIFHVGGWANKDKLYCVRPAYDLESEDFKVSYLAHEGRHLADFKKFPKIDGVNLEYRAKLTELILAEKTLSEILDKFINEARNDLSNPHSYASHLVIQNLSKSIKKEVEISQLQSREIRGLARVLLKEHTDELIRQLT